MSCDKSVKMNNHNVIYYESHLTIEPVFGERLDKFKNLAKIYEFQVADLLLHKNRKETPIRSQKDSFCTAKNKNFDLLHNNMYQLVKVLKANDFKVWRNKIEAVILDEKYDR